MVDGKPVLSINRGKRGNDVLQPRVRETALEQAVPVVAADVLRNFDAKPQVVTQETINAAPYSKPCTQARPTSRSSATRAPSPWSRPAVKCCAVIA